MVGVGGGGGEPEIKKIVVEGSYYIYYTITNLICHHIYLAR